MSTYRIESEIQPVKPEPERGRRKVVIRWHIFRNGNKVATFVTRRQAREALREIKEKGETP